MLILKKLLVTVEAKQRINTYIHFYNENLLGSLVVVFVQGSVCVCVL